MATMLSSILVAVAIVFLPSSLAFSSSSKPGGILSWKALQSKPALDRPPPPIYHDTLPSEDAASLSSLPVLYRDKECICAACESVWLALEVKNINYVTVLVDKNDQVVPRIEWSIGTDDDEDDGKREAAVITSDPIKLLEQIQSRYPDNEPNFYPKLSAAVDASRCNVMRLPGVMPRNSDESLMSYAPYLFRTDGTLVKPSSHAVSLEEVEEMQEEYYLGDFLCGKTITAADIIWAPYLERYAVQLPLVFPNKAKLNPRNRNVYGEVDNWYKIMERECAPYVCRVMGDKKHWRSCLDMAINTHNERAASDNERVSLSDIPKESGWWLKKNGIPNDIGRIWKEYSQDRPWHADSAGGEIALFMSRNHEMIVKHAVNTGHFDVDTADEALREVIQVLLDWDIYFDQSSEDVEQQPLSEVGHKMALFVAEEIIQVPRDVGVIPARTLWELIWSCSEQ